MVGIYAHRGASFELPENTLSAFARAIELQADGIELDVHLSSDGIPVVIHDDLLDRTGLRNSPVAGHAGDLDVRNDSRRHRAPFNQPDCATRLAQARVVLPARGGLRGSRARGAE